MPGDETSAQPKAPELGGVHHVRLPTADVNATRDWYADVLGFSPIIDLEEEDRLVGVVLEHPSGVVLGFHLDPERAAALQGFAVVGISVDDLEPWLAYLDDARVEHGPIIDSHIGTCIQVIGPDGLVIELHSADQPSALEA